MDFTAVTKRARARALWGILAVASAGVLSAILAQADGPPVNVPDLPPLCIEISPEHPLFLFQDSGAGCNDAASYAQHVRRAWETLPKEIRPFSAIQVEARGADVAARNQWFRELLFPLQDADIPTVIRLADADLRRVYPLNRAEELLREYTCVKGIQAVSLPFEDYLEFGLVGGELFPAYSDSVTRWLIGAIDLAARYGRFISIELDEIRWPRVMANTSCRPLYQKMRDCANYVVPVVLYRGVHTMPQTSAALGLWLEGGAAQWGVGPQSRWYLDARFIEPGVFGVTDKPDAMPPPLYRAMILNGVMTGACVFSFGQDSDLWFGAAKKYWDDAIFPTLAGVLDGGLIPRQDFVAKKVRVGYQLAPAATAEEFHLDLRDIDGVLDKGLLMHGAYGIERPGQIAELIPNNGRFYWIPIFSANATPTALAPFGTIVPPGAKSSPEAWMEFLSSQYVPDGEGNAFIARVGRGIFIMNTCENRYETQTFKLASVPAPVRHFEVSRQENGVLIKWPFRERDLSYKVYRKTVSEARSQVELGDDRVKERFVPISTATEERQFLDSTADLQTAVAYSITALTDDTEPYEGVVNYGEYLTLSNVESRIAEEAVITPLLTSAQSKPIEQHAQTPLAAEKPWWPQLDGLTETQIPIATAISRQIEAWDRAFTDKDLGTIVGMYAVDYEDPQGWHAQYAARAYKWFFEHYNTCHMDRQIRQWNFANYESGGQVSVLLYCRFAGTATTGPSGREADRPAWFPRTPTGEVWVTFIEREGHWQIFHTDPALPNFKDILSFSASPFDNLPLGPDN